VTRGPASNLPGSPSADYWNQRMTPANLLGLSPGAGSRSAAGAALPPTTAGGGDRVAVPWHPDSPLFWLLLIGGATVAGITGASVKVRAFKGRAGASIGTT
jgi:hypothetical protein